MSGTRYFFSDRVPENHDAESFKELDFTEFGAGGPMRSRPALKDCHCGGTPVVVTEAMTSDWEGIKCNKCDRVVYGLPDAYDDWNSGEDDQ